MNIDGKAISRELLADVRARIAGLGRTPVVRALVICPTAATESYLRIKQAKALEAGMHLELVRMENDASTEDLLHKLALPGADAAIVQLPLPENIDTPAVLDAIPLAEDADLLSRAAYERFLADEEGALLPPVVAAIAEILARTDVQTTGKRAVVVGEGRLVGAPAYAWLKRAGAQVDALTEGTFATHAEMLKEADIVVSGAGSPGLIRPHMVREGAVLIDAGTSESEGAIVGDFDPACAETASVFTPVPGGVGPIAVACLFKNVANLLGR